MGRFKAHDSDTSSGKLSAAASCWPSRSVGCRRRFRGQASRPGWQLRQRAGRNSRFVRPPRLVTSHPGDLIESGRIPVAPTGVRAHPIAACHRGSREIISPDLPDVTAGPFRIPLQAPQGVAASEDEDRHTDSLCRRGIAAPLCLGPATGRMSEMPWSPWSIESRLGSVG